MTLQVGALFAGIGGLDLGFERAGGHVRFACEIDPVARDVLKTHFPGLELFNDIQLLERFPKIDLLTAGFPCQDISLAGTRLGLGGTRSGLVNHVFRLMELNQPEFVLVENVLNLLRLEGGNVMRSILQDFEALGYRWAYRVVDTRGFGLPQRRLRVVILATNGPQSPAQILLSGLSGDDIADRILPIESRHDYGFYWTEGKRGIGWAIDSVPTIKGGSGLGIPSPPAVFSTRHNLAGTISIEDAERMQGFPAGWTDVDQAKKVGDRWRLVGNAVSVPLSEWVASRINTTYGYGETPLEGEVFNHSGAIPRAAYVENGKWISVNASSIIGKDSFVPLREFLQFPLKPLSVRALSGYLSRAHQGERKFPEGFLDALSLQRDETPESGFSPFIL